VLQGKPELAAGVYKRVLELDPSNSAARLALARSESEKGNYRRSLELMSPALGTLKQSPDGLYLLAADYLNTGNQQAAAALANDWSQLSAVPAEWSSKFALLLAKKGVLPEAIAVLEHAEQQAGPPSYELAFNLAGVYLLNHDPAHALEQY